MKNNIIEGISLENFRVFKDKSDFELAPITILTGANSSGKSSVIKALKLMQDFYKYKDNQSLNFKENEESSYHHQLGDFNMVLNRDNSDKKEFTISYKIPYKYWDNDWYNYWGDLFIENTFCLNENSNLNNGKLHISSIYIEKDEERILISQIDYNSQNRYFNIPFIIDKFQSLFKKFSEYKNKIEQYIVKVDEKNRDKIFIEDGDIVTIKDYTGPVSCQYNFYPTFDGCSPVLEKYYPQINQQFCDFMGFDYTKFRIFDSNGVLTSYQMTEVNDLKPISINELMHDYGNFNMNESCIKNPKLLESIAQIPLENYDNFEQSLWNILVEKDSTLFNKHSFESFLKLFTKSDEVFLPYVEFDGVEDRIYSVNINDENASLQSIKDFIKANATKDFDSFLTRIMGEIHKENSNYLYNNHESITSQIMNDYYNHGGKYPNSCNVISILRYFYLFEYYLNLPNDTTQEYKETKLKKSDLYSLIETAEKELDKLTYFQIALLHTDSDFVEAVRANTQRLYTFNSQGTSFNQLLAKFSDKKYPLDFVNKWVKEFEIGDGIDYQTDLLPGVGIQLNIMKGDKKINIVDLGYGITQFLALLLRIFCSAKEGKIIMAIEEPETNLHPKYQSKLADLFFDAYKQFGIHFIIETHSEYLIRKLQYMTAKGDVKPDETVIHYIGNPDATKREPEEEQVRIIHIQANGDLSQPFGKGFFDEADNLAMQLWSFSKN